MARMETFKVNHSPNIDYRAWAKRLYGDNKMVVSAVEKGKEGHDHVHFIGYTSLSPTDFEYEYGEIKAEHPWHDEKIERDGKLEPRWTAGQLKHVMRRGLKEVNELGFQYVMKTNAKPEYSQGFMEGELEGLKAASDEHVDKLKSGAKELVHGKKYAGTPKEIFRRMQHDVLGYNRENNIPFRPQFRRNCLWIMATHPQCNSSWDEFILDNA